VKIVLILGCCALVIIGLLYRAVGAYLRDRERIRRNSAGGQG
jgi:hypothetical protein